MRDVVIVGGGPAGSTTAISLKTAMPSLRVTLVDKARFPRDKACGDGLGPGVVRVLESLNALQAVEGCLRPRAVLVGGPRGYEGYAEGPTVRGRDLSGFIVPRRVFDSRLIEVARSRGVEVLEEAEFRSSLPTRLGRTVTLQSGADEFEIETQYLVGADGAYSRVRRDIGVGKHPKELTHLAVRAYADYEVRDARAHGALRIDFEEELLPAYGWVFPTAANEANIGVGIPIHLLATRNNPLETMLQSYVISLAARGVAVGNLRSVRSHQLPHAAQLPRLVHGNAILVGDAASMINSLSGEGISYGMTAGFMLGEALAHVLAGTDSHALEKFEENFRRRFGRHLQGCWLGHRFLRSPAWATLVIKAVQEDQSVMEDTSQMLFDEQVMRIGTGLRIIARAL